MTKEKYEERIERLEKIVEDHEKELRAFKDIKELQDLHTRYAYLLCTREWEKIVDLFTDDAVAVLHRRGRSRGKEELTKIFKEVVQNNRGRGRDGHIALQPDIQVKGDKATAHWLMYIMILDPNGGHENMWTHGRHDVEYVRVDGAWKIKYMLFTSPWPREAWSNPTLEQLAEWEKGA
jgi:ketosteroid isomerase-like protein